MARAEEFLKALDDPWILVVAARRVKVEFAQELVMVLRVHKSVSSVVRLIIGHVIVPTLTMAPPIQRNAILEPTPTVRGPAVLLTSLLVQKQLSFGDARVFVECGSDSVIPKFLRTTLDTLWRARIDLCMHNLVQPQTHLSIYRSVFVHTSSRPVFEALDQRCDGHFGLPHAVFDL